MSARCCPERPLGPQGQRGPQGIQGIIGVDGIPGIQGLQGPCHRSIQEFSSLYSVVNQKLGPNGNPSDVVLLENNNIVSAAFDSTSACTTGAIIFLRSGVYFIHWYASGIISDFSARVSHWSLSIYINGVIVRGSTFPAQNALIRHTGGGVLIEVHAGDILMLRNRTPVTVTLVGDSRNFDTSAAINILQIK
jgi:hypothetical protein